MKNAMVKASPEIVATFLVSTLMHGQREQRDGDHHQADRNLRLADVEIQRHLPLARAGLLVAQHQHRERLHGEAPDHAERVGFAQHVDVAAADEMVDELQHHDQVDQPEVVPNL